jgi:integrase
VYWVTTDDQDEDCFILAITGRQGRYPLAAHVPFTCRLHYLRFLMTGMREQEVMHTYWSDVNLAASTIRVSHKPDRGWTPKAYKEREIPIPTKLVKSLKFVEGQIR